MGGGSSAAAVHPAGGRTSAGDRVAENQHPASVRRDGASGRVHIKADRGWTVFEIPSTPGSLAAVRLATCGPDRARFARAVTRSSSSDVVSQRAGSQQWRLRSSIGEGEMLRARSPAPTHGSSYFIFSVAERVSRRLLVLRSARPGHREHMSALEANISVSEDQQHARVLSTKPRTQHGGVVSCPQNSERSRARAQESLHPSPS